jgi:hypothetical protein
VVVPQATSYEGALARSLRASLQAQVGTVEGVGLRRPAAGQPVKVVMVDTAPDSLFGGLLPVGNDRHGDTLANIVHDVACGPLGCAAEPATALALPWLDENTFSSGGGHAGRLSDLALALMRAFDAGAPKGGQQHLILNLSLGWEDQPGLAECSDTPASSTAPARAVHDVLQYVTCRGALVIAAAGNDAAGAAPPHGMICPARWESQPISACPGAPVEPLVNAVGGLDYADHALALTRPEGRPRLAALGLGGEGWRHGTLSPPPLTGSSVSAAVMSAVAAVVWSRAPGLSRAELVSEIYEAGLPLPTAAPADACPFGVPGPCPVRRVSLCSALLSLGAGGITCTPPPALAAGTPPFAPDVHPELAFPSPTGTPAPALPVTGGIEIARDLSPSPALSGGVFPQPIYPICPSCCLPTPVSGNSIFYATLSAPLTTPRLVFTTSTGRTAAVLGLGTTSLASSTPYSMAISAIPTGATHAYLTGYSDNTATNSVTQEVLMSP